MANTEGLGHARKRRPNYSLAFKRQLAERACGENVVAQLALEHGLNTNMVFKWRRQLPAGMLSDATGLLPVALASNNAMRPASAQTTLIEVRIGGAVVRIESAPDAETLGVVLRSLQR